MSISSTGWFSSKVHTQAVLEVLKLRQWSRPPVGACRQLVYIALYDGDADPFTLIDPDTDADSDLYTGSTSDLLWLRVATEGSAQGIELLVNR